MRILRRMAERQPEMLQTCLAAGLKRTSALHECICSNYHASTSAADAGKRGCLLSASFDAGRYRSEGHQSDSTRHTSPVSLLHDDGLSQDGLIASWTLHCTLIPTHERGDVDRMWCM